MTFITTILFLVFLTLGIKNLLKWKKYKNTENPKNYKKDALIMFALSLFLLLATGIFGEKNSETENEKVIREAQERQEERDSKLTDEEREDKEERKKEVTAKKEEEKRKQEETEKKKLAEEKKKKEEEEKKPKTNEDKFNKVIEDVVGKNSTFEYINGLDDEKEATIQFETPFSNNDKRTLTIMTDKIARLLVDLKNEGVKDFDNIVVMARKEDDVLYSLRVTKDQLYGLPDDSIQVQYNMENYVESVFMKPQYRQVRL